jgi:hypothetical protein
VTPQYNWGYPASLKNAIDYLFHEWVGKPGLVVSYGGRGGGKCNAQLREVLKGVRMVTTERYVELVFPDREVLTKASRGEEFGLRIGDDHSHSRGDGDGLWSEKRKEILEAFKELEELVVGRIAELEEEKKKGGG